MNEIATWGQKMPDNVLFNNEGETASHLQVHNVYGLNMARASFEGFRQALNRRPFVLSRSGYAGLQRYSAIWTGDNRSEEDHMLLGVRLLCSLGLSGMPFTGMDIGGFTGNPDGSLYARWMEVGSFNPYMRNHTAVNTKASEPWAYGEQVLEIARNYINLRYRLLPYAYSMFYEASQTGLPVMRSLAIDYTFDPAIYQKEFQNQYLYGSAFLVAPFDGPNNYGSVYFPKGKWYNLYTDEQIAGGKAVVFPLTIAQLPVFVRESSIIPMQSLVQTTAQAPTDTLTIHVYEGAGSNAFVYYEDDGASYNYEKGDYYRRRILFHPEKKEIVFEKAEGTYASKFRYIKLALHGFGGSSFSVSGRQATSHAEFESLLAPISKFDPQGTDEKPEGHTIKTMVLPNGPGEMVVGF
jgi:alpha-glucosidase